MVSILILGLSIYIRGFRLSATDFDSQSHTKLHDDWPFVLDRTGKTLNPTTTHKSRTGDMHAATNTTLHPTQAANPKNNQTTHMFRLSVQDTPAAPYQYFDVTNKWHRKHLSKPPLKFGNGLGNSMWVPGFQIYCPDLRVIKSGI